MKAPDERDLAHFGAQSASFLSDAIRDSAQFRKDYLDKLNIVPGETMPFERSPEGLIKHLIHERLNTKEYCIEAYMQFIPGGSRSGKHRHMWEEVAFVAEGAGYDLDRKSTRLNSSH